MSSNNLLIAEEINSDIPIYESCVGDLVIRGDVHEKLKPANLVNLRFRRLKVVAEADAPTDQIWKGRPGWQSR